MSEKIPKPLRNHSFRYHGNLQSNMFGEEEFQEDRQAVPNGIIDSGSYNPSQDSISGIESGTQHVHTFEVKAEHKVLSSKKDGATGVRFNVETVPKPLRRHKKKGILTRKVYIKKVNEVSNRQLEAVSRNDDVNIVHVSKNGFLVACVTAFAQHLPLGLSPDHIWALITYVFAKHVDNHAEELRLTLASDMHLRECMRHL